MKAHLINTHLVVPWSRSSAKVKVEYRVNFSKNDHFWAISVSQTHLVFLRFDSYQNDRILNLSKLKAFVEVEINATQIF